MAAAGRSTRRQLEKAQAKVSSQIERLVVQELAQTKMQVRVSALARAHAAERQGQSAKAGLPPQEEASHDDLGGNEEADKQSHSAKAGLPTRDGVFGRKFSENLSADVAIGLAPSPKGLPEDPPEPREIQQSQERTGGVEVEISLENLAKFLRGKPSQMVVAILDGIRA